MCTTTHTRPRGVLVRVSTTTAVYSALCTEADGLGISLPQWVRGILTGRLPIRRLQTVHPRDRIAKARLTALRGLRAHGHPQTVADVLDPRLDAMPMPPWPVRSPPIDGAVIPHSGHRPGRLPILRTTLPREVVGDLADTAVARGCSMQDHLRHLIVHRAHVPLPVHEPAISTSAATQLALVTERWIGGLREPVWPPRWHRALAEDLRWVLPLLPRWPETITL